LSRKVEPPRAATAITAVAHDLVKIPWTEPVLPASAVGVTRRECDVSDVVSRSLDAEKKAASLDQRE
jgi:hypothetical protein